MSNILISTAIRNSTFDQPSGHLFVYDAEENKIIRRCSIIEPPYREVDPNPRGGFRGLKGLSMNGNMAAISNASSIFLYDQSWKLLRHLSHPTCAGIHEIELNDECVWITSSRNDLLLCMDFSGNIVRFFNVRNDPLIQKLSPHKLKPLINDEQVFHGKIDFRNPLSHDHAITDNLHINSFAFVKNNGFLLSCGLFRTIDNFYLHRLNHCLKQSILRSLVPNAYNIYQQLIKKGRKVNFEAKAISKTKTISSVIKVDTDGNVQLCLLLDDCIAPSHSIKVLIDNSAIYLNTTTGEIIHFDPENNQILSIVRIGTTFLRGALQLHDQSLLLGDNNTLIHFDLEGKRIISKTIISDNVAEGIFDLCVLPENFDIPPMDFSEKPNE